MCLVTWPVNESEAGVDLVMIQISSFSYVNDVIMLISKNLHKKSSGFYQNKVNSSLNFIHRPSN